MLVPLIMLIVINRRLNDKLFRSRLEKDSMVHALALKKSPNSKESPVLSLDLPAKESMLPKPTDRWSDPVWRGNRFNAAIIRIESQYGRFFLGIKATPEKKEAIKEQMAQNQMLLMELAEPKAGPVTDAERKAVGDAVLETLKSNKASLKASLGEEDYSALQRFNSTEAYRSSVDSITNAMRSKGIDVGGDLEETVLNEYTAATNDRSGEPSMPDPVGSSTLSQEQQPGLKSQQMQSFRIRLQKRMSAVLNDQQLSAFMESEMEQSNPDGSD